MIGNLISAFNFVSPTPIDFMVYRRMNNYLYELDKISIEKGFLSTSLYYFDEQERRKAAVDALAAAKLRRASPAVKLGLPRPIALPPIPN